MIAIATKSSTNEKPCRLEGAMRSPFFTERAKGAAERILA